MKRYEGMFLFDSSAAREWSAIEQEVHRLCDRINAELLVCVKFDDRKLAYDIDRRKRGTYVLTYFEAAADRIVDLERDVGLSELVMRVLVLRADQVPEERIAELKAWPAETPLQPFSSDGRRHDDERGPRGARGDVWTSRSAGSGAKPERAKEPAPVAAPVENVSAAPVEAGADMPTPELPPAEPPEGDPESKEG